MPNQKTILEDHSIDLSDLVTQAKGNIAHLAFLFALYTTNFTEPLSYQDSAFLKLPKFP